MQSPWRQSRFGPRWRRVDENDLEIIKPLQTSPRSPFYSLDAESSLSMLCACKADIIETPQPSRDPHGDLEGFMLFREQKSFSRIYIPLDGLIVFFGSKDGDVHRERMEDVGSTFLLDNGHSFSGFVGSGQVAGLIEFLTSFIEKESREKRASGDHEQRKEALAKAYLLSKSGRWLRSGFVSNGTHVLSIPEDNFIRLIRNEKSDGRFKKGKFIRRCEEEVVLRYNEQLHMTSMMGMGMHDKLLALHLYEYHERTKRLEVIGTRAHVAWYSNLRDTNRAGLLIRRLLDYTSPSGKHILWRIGDQQRSTRYGLDPQGLFDYYRQV